VDISEQLQRAFDSAVTGDVEPLVSLMDSDMEWRGITSGRLWWKRTPS